MAQKKPTNLGSIDNIALDMLRKPSKQENKDEEERENWGSPTEFFLASLGYTRKIKTNRKA